MTVEKLGDGVAVDSSSIQVLLDWYNHEVREMYRIFPHRGQGGLLIGFPIWGKEFARRFGVYCLSSMCSPANLEALKGCRIEIFTDKATTNDLIRMVHPLAAYGIDAQVHEIPAKVMALWESNPWSRFPIIGTIQTICLMMAGRANVGYHSGHPDHIFGPEYWPNLKALAPQYHAIIQMGISGYLEDAKAEIERYRDADFALTIPDRDLCSIAWRHLHKQMQNLLMNNAKIPKKMPFGHYLLWQGKDKLRIHSPHHNPAFLSPTLCQRFTPRSVREITSPIDTRMPLLIKEGDTCYVAGADDGLGFIELSDGDKAVGPWLDGFGFAMDCWRRVGFGEGYMPFFFQPCEVPIEPQDKFFTEEKINKQFEQVTRLLYRHRPMVERTSLQAMFQGKMPDPPKSRVA